MKHNAIIIGSIVVAVGAISVAGIATAVGGDDHEVPITGDALVRATDAALAHTGGGTVTGTEEGDEDSYYEVEVTLDSGDQVDVQLDREFRVVGAVPDVDDDTGSD